MILSGHSKITKLAIVEMITNQNKIPAANPLLIMVKTRDANNRISPAGFKKDCFLSQSSSVPFGNSARDEVL